MKINKNTPQDLSTVGRHINVIGGVYVVIQGSNARYQSRNRGLNIEFEIDSLKDHKENFSASLKISPEENKHLSALSKGKHDVTFCSDENRKLYRVTNQHIKVNLDHTDVNLTMPPIAESIKNAEQIGPPVNVSTRHEIGITGRERTISLVVRNNTFTGIINSTGEYFLDPDYPEEAGVERRIYKSCYFLKIGKEQFTLKLYRKKNCYLLLTKVSIGTGIQCRMLETLIIQ